MGKPTKLKKPKSLKSLAAPLVVLPDIPLTIECPHEGARSRASCSIGYFPKGRLLGIGSFSRIVRKSAEKPALQEDITDGIASALQAALKPAGLAVLVRCRHSCGDPANGNEMVTLSTSGRLRKKDAREEFFSCLRLNWPGKGRKPSNRFKSF